MDNVSQHLLPVQAMGTSTSGDGEAQTQSIDNRRRGGWVTFPFMIATMAALTLAGGGWLTNLIVYLIREFNVKSIEAAQISNIFNGCVSLFPILGAILADSYLGSYYVILASSFISFLGTLCLFLTATIDSLRPQPCENGPNFCTPPSKFQEAVLYTSLSLATLGFGGTRFTMGTMGAHQFSVAQHQETYFNWYFFTMYFAAMMASTAIVYIQDNVSWGWGFGVCMAANVLGLAVFLVGSRYYHHVKPESNPFTSLARVIIATIRKRKVLPPSKSEEYYYGGHDVMSMMATMPSEKFRFLNRAAQRTEGDVGPDGLIAKPWKLCTVQQVEDFKTLIKIIPLWSTSIFLGTPIGILSSLSILQALTMDHHLGPHFQTPPGSIIVFTLFSTLIALTLFDRFLWPTWKKLIGPLPTALQRIGVGHVLNISSMIVAALVELKRRNVAQSHHLQHQPSSIMHISVLWLVPQLAIVGIGEAFHFPGQVSLYYQEFPTSLKNLSTAMIGMHLAIAFYLSTVVINFVRSITRWLPDNLDDGKLDYVYWMLAVLGIFNFGYYIICALLYKYQNFEPPSNDIHPTGLT